MSPRKREFVLALPKCDPGDLMAGPGLLVFKREQRCLSYCPIAGCGTLSPPLVLLFSLYLPRVSSLGRAVAPVAMYAE